MNEYPSNNNNELDEFETLLKEDLYHRVVHGKDLKDYERQQDAGHNTLERTKANKSASVYDFVKMVHEISTKSLKDLNVDFIMEEDKFNVTDPDIKIENPIICYKLISRKPHGGEIKPRHRENRNAPFDKMVGEQYGQRFKCIVQFNIFASGVDLAEHVLERFEDMMFDYTGYFKQNGVQELLFNEQLSDDDYNLFRQTIAVKNLRYEVIIEKLYNQFSKRIEIADVNNVNPTWPMPNGKPIN